MVIWEFDYAKRMKALLLLIVFTVEVAWRVMVFFLKCLKEIGVIVKAT